MASRREIENLLYAELESATKRHQVAKDDLIALSKSVQRESGDREEDDPLVRNAERTLRNARLALLAALQRYNAFVSKGIVPERLKDKCAAEGADCETESVQIPTLAGK